MDATTPTSVIAVQPPSAASRPGIHPRTQAMIDGPVVKTLLRMAWPNILVMLAQSSSGLIETWFVAKLGTAALAGMAMVIPGLMLMLMVSAGAVGGGISSAIARALGAGKRDEAESLAVHALVIGVAIGAIFTAVMLIFGRNIYAALGATDGELEAALTYSNVVFSGSILMWVMNGLASILRGTGNMLVPAMVTIVGVIFLVPLSPVLIFGLGPIPALGIAGGGVAMLLFFTASALVLGWYILAGRSHVALRKAALRWDHFKRILGVGAFSSLSAIQTNLIIAVVTALAAHAGGAASAAGYGTAARLEYLLVPLVFGLGAPLVAMVGTNIGAGLQDRALRIAFVGAGIAFALTETIGIAAAIWPHAWLTLFSAEPGVIEAGTSYMRIVGPAYGFFGLGLALYFASQGAARLFWPLSMGILRVIIVLGGGGLALALTGSLAWLFGVVAFGMLFQGVAVFVAIYLGAWFKRPA